MVPFLFGVANRPELPGVVLRHLLMDLGLSAAAAHALVARMRRDGLLSAIRQGKTAQYRLAGTFEEAFRRVRDHATRPEEAWTGAFHAVLYQVPEHNRSFRDALRRSAVLSGYGLLQQGVLISLTDRSAAIAAILDKRPDDAQVFIATLSMEIGAAARAAYRAWDLGELAEVYRGHVGTLQRALAEEAEPPPPSAQALRRFADLARAPLTDTLRDPGLPGVLLPDDWAGAAMRKAIGQFNARFFPPAYTYVQEVLGSPGSATKES